MRGEKQVLLVTPTLALRRTLMATLQRAGVHVTIARTFERAKASLTATLDLVLTELKLGEYNGLQLALRAQSDGIPAIVVADEAFADDVERLGAVWMSPDDAAGDETAPTIERVIKEAEATSDLWCAVDARPVCSETLESVKLLTVIH